MDDLKQRLDEVPSMSLMKYSLCGALLAVALVACGRSTSRAAPPAAEPTPTPAASELPAHVEDDPLPALKAAEARLQRGDTRGFYRPVGFELVTLARDGRITTEPLPQAIHKHGEKIAAAWAAVDGTLFFAGFMYTGVPGPDTGAIYQKDASGPLRVVLTRPGKELSAIWGRSAKDVFAAGKDVLVHWDGVAWKDVPVNGVDGELAGVWGSDGGDLFLVTNNRTDGHVYSRKRDGAWTKETTTRSCFLRGIAGSGASVWAVGDCGLVIARGRLGAWREERRQKGAGIVQVWATSEHELHTAGIDLLHSAGDGAWEAVNVPSTRVFALTGSGRDVYALGTGGVFKGSGKSFRKLAFDSDACVVLAATARDGALHCLRERRQPLDGAQSSSPAGR
jgi:hypothetical protein